MHDAHNLAWKLAAVLGGRAGDSLLETYQAERLPVARRTAAEARATWEIFAGRPPAQQVRGTFAVSTPPRPLDSRPP